MFKDDPFRDAGFLQRTLAGQAKDLASLAAAFSGAAPAGPANLEALAKPLFERYQRLFMPPGLAATAAGPAQSGAAFLRYQQAMERFARQANAIAVNAGERLTRALAQSGPEAPPITTLRELHSLWIDCGEAAYAAAAHREEFADAQAELLAAFVELRAALAAP
jgi:hypothetical protein